MRSRFLVIGTLAGAIVLFAWQFLSHEALGLPERGLRAFPNDSNAVAAHAIRAVAPQNGVYFSAYGAFAAIDITTDYADKRPQFATMLIKQFVLDLGVVLILALLLDRIGDPGIFRTGLNYGALALAYMGFVHVANAIWWGFPTSWTLGNLTDQVITFFLVGLTLAAVRRRFGEPRIATAERPGVRAQGGLGAQGAERGAQKV
ncbi:MAG TPA: hypothetical protein VH539_20755 [Gemmatimonadaceae bacterium]|jgi:hypothetical protein